MAGERRRTRSRRRVRIAGGVTALLAVVLAPAAPAPATPPGPVNGRIACAREFDRGGAGAVEVVTMDPNGGNVQRLTTNSVPDFDPIWSPDGREIVFESFREANVSELYRMNADGSGVVRLTTNGAPEDRPGGYHPDGSQLVSHTARDGDVEVYKMNADGPGAVNLTVNPAFDGLPTWSPDGAWIFFSSDRGSPSGALDVRRMSSFGGEPGRLSRNAVAEDAAGDVSPDGTRVVFHTTRDTPAGQPPSFDINVMNADGSGKVRLTSAPGDDLFPVWSPDGRRIAFDSHRDGDREVYVMNADGSGQQRITSNPGFDGHCAWQRPCTVTGSGLIRGTDGADVICGSPGNDRLEGLGGNDQLLGLGGDDQLYGGAGDDALFGGVGTDSLAGLSGTDFSSGGPASDRIIADAGERVDPGAGRNFCTVGGVLGCPPRLS